MASHEVNVTLKNATLADIEAQAEQSRQLFEIYRTINKVSKEPGEVLMSFDIRTQKGEVAKGSDLTLDRLYAEAARFRILQAIDQHVRENVVAAPKSTPGAVTPELSAPSFSLSFGLSCSRKVNVAQPEAEPTQV